MMVSLNNKRLNECRINGIVRSGHYTQATTSHTRAPRFENSFINNYITVLAASFFSLCFRNNKIQCLVRIV